MEVFMSQDNWRWCNKCQGLFFAGNPTSVCPAGGQHNPPATSGSADYILDDNVGTPRQANWRWCNKCQGLFFAGNPTTGACPARGGHDFSGSADYDLNMGAITGTQQPSWRWCNKCQGLFYGGNPTTGNCPAGGGHTYSGSADYKI